ncbi:MAG: hypothetical protein WB579_19500 [Bryobacteraceae bacterium]
MNSLFRKYGFLTVVAVLFFASASFAQTTTMTITGVGDGANLAGVYVDPYTATVGGATNVSVICDDWSDNVTIGESWTANVINLPTVGNSSLGTPLYGNNQGLYNELAWLGTQLLANSTNPATQDVISFAIWELTYSDYPYSPEAYPALSTSEQALVTNELALANAETNFNGSGWAILTPASGGPGEAQEFLVYTPESSAVVVLCADMLGLLGLVILFRRRLLRPVL